MVAKFKIDGILYHDAKTCPNNSNNRYGLPQRLQEKLGMPYLVINGDLNDLRYVLRRADADQHRGVRRAVGRA